MEFPTAFFNSYGMAVNQITKLEADFGAFLDVLEPFDIKSAQLKPGQVKKVWVNPDFIKKLKK